MSKRAKKKESKKQSKETSKDRSNKFMVALKAFIRTQGSDYLKDPNITSVGIGYKDKDGKPTKELAVRFTVGKKVKPEDLESLGTKLLPESFEIDGVKVPTDVIERKYATEFRLVPELEINDRKKRLNPILPGSSVAHVKETAGTIGCIVYDRTNGIPYVLSNWHVLNGPEGTVGDDIVQPGPFDDNRINVNRLGKLVRSHVGHAGDCGVSTIEGRGFSTKIMELGVEVENLGEPELGDKVVKSGRTTGVTHGIVSSVHVIAKLDYGGSIGEQEVGGFEIGVDPDNFPENGEVSMGGDSGSVWLFKSDNGKPTNIMAGLHFAGETSPNPDDEHAVACYAKSVLEKLDVSLHPPMDLERAPETGFKQDFLSSRVDLPKLSLKNQQNAFKLNGSEVLNYTHFSLTLNKVRKFSFWVAWNIDGGDLKLLSRKGIPFVLDARVPGEFQAGDELYAGNRLDRGHIARRKDLLWGGMLEAKKANRDSFFFTNIAPQMDDFNQAGMGGLWGHLENAVFEDTEVENMKVSLFGGPVFRPDDREFRGIKLPREFWKVIVFVEDNKLKAKGFLLTQNLDALEVFELDRFKIFQVALTEIEDRCGIKFAAALKAADSVGERLTRRPEALRQRKPLSALEEIDWS
jgi:endonuclease G, mitochondrial